MNEPLIGVAFLPCGISGSEGISIDIDDGFLPEVNPENVFLFSVLLQDGLQDSVKALDGGLAGSKDWKTWHLK